MSSSTETGETKDLNFRLCIICGHIRLSHIIPVFLGNFRQSRGILENLGNLERKMTNSRILEQLKHSPDILATFHRQKRWKNVFFVFLTTKRGLSPLTCYTAVSRGKNEKSKDYCKADPEQRVLFFHNNISAGHTSLLQCLEHLWRQNHNDKPVRVSRIYSRSGPGCSKQGQSEISIQIWKLKKKIHFFSFGLQFDDWMLNKESRKLSGKMLSNKRQRIPG